jgi:iron complex outermembrane receptor protein
MGLMLSLGTVTVVNAAARDLEEVVVTGSHVRGPEAAGSKLIVIGRERIDASGYCRFEKVLATAAQNLDRANAAVGDSPDSGFYSLKHAAEVQLLGLGGGTALTLVNGQHQGASG